MPGDFLRSESVRLELCDGLSRGAAMAPIRSRCWARALDPVVFIPHCSHLVSPARPRTGRPAVDSGADGAVVGPDSPVDPANRRCGCGTRDLGWPHQSSPGAAGGPAGPCHPVGETSQRAPCLRGRGGPSGGEHFLLNELGMDFTALEFRSIEQGEVEFDGGWNAGDGTFR